MSRLASVEVRLDVQVTVLVQAEQATDVELAAFVAKDPEGVKGGILAALESNGCEKSAGWLDDSREAFVTEVIGADGLNTADHRGHLQPCLPTVVA